MKYSWLLTTLLLTHPAAADTITLGSVADAEIRQLSPGNTHGNLETAVSGRLGDAPTANSEQRRALLRFDVSSIPAAAVVTSATLTVVVTQAPTELSRADSNFNLRRVLQSWRENEVTWTTRLAPNLQWDSPGAGGAADIAASISSSVFVQGADTYTFPSTETLVSDVQRWITNAASNVGWLLLPQDQTTLRTARHFGTRENLTPANRPVLTVNYTVPVIPANAPTISAVSQTNSQLVFTFNAESNRPYTVESRASFSATNWNIHTNITAAPSPTNHVVTDVISSTTKFYRVKTP